jgi:hypothetical protein
MKTDQPKEIKCKKGNHEFCHTIDPRYMRCLKCPVVKKVKA